MRFDDPKTLSYFLDLPQRRALKTGAQVTAAAIKKTVSEQLSALQSKKVGPDMEGVEFYALNQLVAGIQGRFTAHEELPLWAQNACMAYSNALASQSLRLMHYVLLIITREARHLNYTDAFFSNHGAAFHKAFKPFHALIAGAGSDGAVQKFLSHAPDMPLDVYCSHIVDVFNKGKYNGGYGGKPWGRIAECLRKMVAGETSAEIFIDTAYTLAHNNGPIFNKGMHYNHYSDKLKNMLDIQRSGQICEMVLSDTWKSLMTHTDTKGEERWAGLKTLIQAAKKEASDICGDYVDWYQVEALGSLAKYPTEKAQQVKKYGAPSETAVAKGKPGIPTPDGGKPVISLFNGKPVKYTSNFEVLSGQFVKVFERVAA